MHFLYWLCRSTAFNVNHPGIVAALEVILIKFAVGAIVLDGKLAVGKLLWAVRLQIPGKLA